MQGSSTDDNRGTLNLGTGVTVAAATTTVTSAAIASQASPIAAMTDDNSKKDGLSRTIDKQVEEIEAITSKISLWTKYRDDYLDLKKLINQMQDRIKFPHKIPIAGSKLAFVKGNIIHTNELTVLLGDNYFAVRSARQADKIIDRRLVEIKDSLAKCQDAKRKTEDWLKAVKQIKQEKEEFVEIIETM